MSLPTGGRCCVSAATNGRGGDGEPPSMNSDVAHHLAPLGAAHVVSCTYSRCRRMNAATYEHSGTTRKLSCRA